MARATRINHATLIVDDLEAARAFYENELGLEPLPTYDFDYPTQFYRVNDDQQLHLTEWEDNKPFRGHLCMQVDEFNPIFYRMRDLGTIDIEPWGRVRRLPDGPMQMFVRDPAGNLVEITCSADTPVDEEVFEDELVEEGASLYVSGREDHRGERGESASLFHGRQDRE